MVRIVDLVGEVLDLHDVSGGQRVTYRLFAKQLVNLMRKGRITVRARANHINLIKKLEQIELKWHIQNMEGLLTQSWFKSHRPRAWAYVERYEELREFYVGYLDMKPKVLDEIKESIEKLDPIPIVII